MSFINVHFTYMNQLFETYEVGDTFNFRFAGKSLFDKIIFS